MMSRVCSILLCLEFLDPAVDIGEQARWTRLREVELVGEVLVRERVPRGPALEEEAVGIVRRRLLLLLDGRAPGIRLARVPRDTRRSVVQAPHIIDNCPRR